MKNFLLVLALIVSFTLEGWGANNCSGTTNVNLSSVTYTNSSSTNATGKTYYFTADGPGTVTITTTTTNNMALNASTTACPTNVGGVTTQTLTLTAADKDFNVRVFRTNGSSSNQNFTITVNFTRDCSPYKGQVMLNELRIGSTTTTHIANQIELYNYANVPESTWRTWKLVLYSKSGTNAPKLRGPYALSSITQFTANGQFIYNNNLAIYLRNRNGRSVDVALVDANGALIDYVAVESIIQNVPSCFGTPSVVNATPSGNTIGDIARLPDGGIGAIGSGWPANVSNTASHTISRTNVCTPGNDLVVTNSADTLNPIINTSLVTYTVNVLNKSCSTSITGITLTDTNISTTYFNGLSYTRTQGTSTQGPSSLSWNVGTLAAGASATLTIAGTPKVLGILPTTASVTATTALDAAYRNDDSDTETINVRDFNYVRFDLNSTTLTEGTDSAYSASISSNLIASSPITVNYTVSGTAGTGDTNLPVSGSVVIDPTDPETPTQTTIDFTITDDTISEPPKSINFHITSITSSDASVKLDTTAQDMNITLNDDDDPLIVDYRFDECSGNTNINDSSSSGYDTVGSVDVLSGQKLCNAKTFNGTTQYITLPTAISNQLKTSASLSFWIQTTQVGNNTNWLAPGITGVEQSGGLDDIFWGWIDANGQIGLNAKGDGTQAKSTVAINDGTWKHIVLTRDASSGQLNIYINGILNSTGTGGTGTIGTSFSRFGSIEDTGGTPTYFNGNIDEIKVFSRVLSSGEVTAVYTNDAASFNYDGSTRSCQICTTNCTSFQYDLYHPTSTAHKLLTRISQQSFDLNTSVSCTSGTGTIPSRKITKIYAVSGTCPTITTGLPVLWTGSSDINDTNKIITLSNLNSTKAYSNIKLMLETNASEFNCSSDSFAIRPPLFAITSPLSTIPANIFSLQLSALNSNSGYNGTANVTTALQTANPSCPISNSFLKSSLGVVEPLALNFNNDINSSIAKAINVGTISINTKDTTWTLVDQPNDCIADSNSTILNGQGLLGCNIENNLTLNIIPDHFDVNATLSNFDGGTFTYLSSDLNMSAQLDLNITAKNGDGNTTTNYTSGCYAKNTNLTLVHSSVPSPLTKILYSESLTTVNTNVLKDDPWTLSLNSVLFNNGSVTPSIHLNFDRNETKPLNPFDFNITSATATDADAITGTGVPLGDTTFIFGRARAYNITTNTSPVNVPIEFEVYSTTSSGFVSGMPQNVLKWYRNLNHDTAAEGNVLLGGFSAEVTDSAINTSTAPANGLQIIEVTSTTDRIIHLDISPWLWYSPKYTYDYSGNCTRHPCFNYDYTDATGGVKGVNSGTFQGSDFQMAPAKNITNKGVKLFR